MKKVGISHRLLALLLSVVLLLSLAACRSGQQGEKEPFDTEPPVVVETADLGDLLGEETPEETFVPDSDVKAGESFPFTKLVGEENGANGLTFYYTADGKTLTEFENYDVSAGKWYQGDDGVLVYPSEIPADNYGVAGSSAAEYVVMGYELPATGTIDLYTWLALQGEHAQHGYQVKVALDDTANVVCQYKVVGDTQTAAANTYALEVKKGQTLYMIYEPLIRKDGEWFGYITSVTYTELGPNSNLVHETIQNEVKKGDVFNFTTLSSNKNGTNGLTYYHTVDGVTLVPFLNRVTEEDKWWHGGNGVLVYPRMDLAENYAVAGSSDSEYVAMGFVLPATGTVDLYSWIAMQGTATHHGYIVKVALGSPENVVYEYGCAGGPDTAVDRTIPLEVEQGQTLYMIYEPTVWHAGEWFGYKTGITYTDVR